MLRILKLVLQGLCVGLLLTIAAELFPMWNQQEFPSAEAKGSAPVGIKPAAPVLDIQTMVTEIRKRPLFSPTRHPPEVASDADVEEYPERAVPQLQGRLAGVMIGPGVREALFVRAGQKPVPVKVGGEIDGWTLAAIEPDRVILFSAFGNQTVRPASGAGVTLKPVHPIDMNLGMGPPMVSRAPAADAPFQPVSQTGRQGLR